MITLGNIVTEARYDGRNAFRGVPGGEHFISLDLVAAHGQIESPRLWRSGGRFVVEVRLPSGQPGLTLICRICATAHEIGNLLRSLNRARNHRRSGQLIAGMLLLLATCGWIFGGEDGAHRAVGTTPLPDDSAIVPEIMLHQVGARLLYPAEMPALFDVLRIICRRAGLLRCPDLYYLPTAGMMNAYSLGGPRRSAITLTDGLLRAMNRNEIAGILAHEVAHIRNGDSCAMTWASMLQRAIALTSLASLAALQRESDSTVGPLAALLSYASAVSQLLYLALSRTREFDADATALEMIDDPQALVSALNKLERHHNTAQNLLTVSLLRDGVEFLRSHPATSERICHLRRLTLWI